MEESRQTETNVDNTATITETTPQQVGFNARAELANKPLTFKEFEALKASLLASGHITEKVAVADTPQAPLVLAPETKTFEDWFNQSQAVKGDAVGASEASLQLAPHLVEYEGVAPQFIFELPPSYFAERNFTQLKQEGFTDDDLTHIVAQLAKHNLELKPDGLTLAVSAGVGVSTVDDPTFTKPVEVVGAFDLLTNAELDAQAQAEAQATVDAQAGALEEPAKVTKPKRNGNTE